MLNILNTLECWYNLPASEQKNFRKFCLNIGIVERDYTVINNLKRMADCHIEPMKFVQNQTSVMMAKIVLAAVPESESDDGTSEDTTSEDTTSEDTTSEDTTSEDATNDASDDTTGDATNDATDDEKKQSDMTNTIQELADGQELEELPQKNNDVSDFLLGFFVFSISFPLLFYNLLILFNIFRPQN